VAEKIEETRRTILVKKRRLVLSATLAGLLLLPAGVFFALDRLFPFPFDRLERPAATVVTDRGGAPLRFYLAPDEKWRFPVALDELPSELLALVVAVEDRFFYQHPGVNPVAIVRAIWANLRAGRIVSGASTIPMQIARMVDPAPRTLSAKLRESFRALQLDFHLQKHELLEAYLNLAPYGGNLEGMGAAGWFYFGKEPRQLALGEIALLTALPRSPSRYDPSRNPELARRARSRVLDRLAGTGLFTPSELEDARLHSIPTARREPPLRAAHLADLVTRRYGPAERIRTTLDHPLQRTAERLVTRRIDDLRAEGIGNAAVVVLDIETRAVRALVGSAAFLDPSHQGQVNGALARRSPGSTLKPFLYGLALDTGAILPDSYLLDIPTDYAGYVAENYDDRYRGRVTARTALVESLNAPAVRLLSRVGLADFHGLLLRGGLETLDRPSGDYGLPLVLGAGEVTLLDLTNLYASLADGGLFRPVSLILDEESDRPSRDSRSADRILSREAAWVLTEILQEVQRPDLPQTWDLTRGAPAVAWKTGTSYGHRDAWAVGFSRRYAIGVWVGNFDGRPRQGISGSEHAAPLLFDLFRAIEPGGVAPARPMGLRVEEIRVCSLSHDLPGPFCPDKQSVPFLPGRSRLGRCELHRRIQVDDETGELLAGGCDQRPFHWQELTLFPAELVAWKRSQGESVTGLPTVSKACASGDLGEPPRIVSPDPSTPYRLRRDAPLAYQQIALTARSGPGTRQLFWYQDGILVGSSSPAEPLFLTPTRGPHRIAVTDDLGRSDGLTYRVE
jgi:penicillin-binding protein 1C